MWNEFLGLLIMAAGVLVALVLILMGLLLYFVPTIFAVRGGKHRRVAIGAVNLLFGWTVVGWVVALLWAITPDRDAAIS